MTSNDLHHLLTDFRSEVPEPDGFTSARIYRRVTAVRPRASRRLPVRVVRPRALAAVAAAALALAGGAGAIAYHYLGPSPGFTAGFAAFAKGQAASWPESLPTVALDNSAAYAGVSPAEFLRRFRLLRTGLTLGPGLSEGEGKLYAYVSQDGRTGCMFLTGQTGVCFKPSDAPDIRGVLPVISPGYPGQAPAMVAVVADSVASVSLDISGRLIGVPIINNSIYTDLKQLEPTETVSLHVRYQDGSTANEPLPNPLRAKASP